MKENDSGGRRNAKICQKVKKNVRKEIKDFMKFKYKTEEARNINNFEA